MISLHECQSEHAFELAALDARCFEPVIRYSEQTFRALLVHPNAICLAARDDRETLAGFCLCLAPDGRSPYAHVVTIDVDPAFRRRGVGSRLVEAMHERMQQKGMVKMMLEVYTENLDALRFYEYHNYRVITRLPAYYGPGQDGFLMHRELDTQ